MLLKADPRKQGDYISFLGRLYLDPWVTKESIIDVPRQLMRIHATVTPKNVPDDVVIWRKIEGYEVNDKNTPIISNWCEIMKKFYPPPSAAQAKKFADITKLEMNWWSRQGNFARLTNIDLAKKVIAEAMELSVDEVTAFCGRIDGLKSLDEINGIKLVRDTKVEIDAVVDGLIKEGESKDHQTQVQANADAAPFKKSERATTKKVIPSFKSPPIGTRKDKLKFDNIQDGPACKFFQKGESCPFGRRCKFRHGK